MSDHRDDDVDAAAATVVCSSLSAGVVCSQSQDEPRLITGQRVLLMKIARH